jgi:hypothetical protein
MGDSPRVCLSPSAKGEPMLIELVEVVDKGLGNYEIKEVFVNPDSIVSVKLDDKTKCLLDEGKLPWDLHEQQSFSRIVLGTIAAESLVVVGTPAQVMEKCYVATTRLLKG